MGSNGITILMHFRHSKYSVLKKIIYQRISLDAQLLQIGTTKNIHVFHMFKCNQKLNLLMML